MSRGDLRPFRLLSGHYSSEVLRALDTKPDLTLWDWFAIPSHASDHGPHTVVASLDLNTAFDSSVART